MSITLQDVWALAGDRKFDNLDMPIMDDWLNFAAKPDRQSKMTELTFLSKEATTQSQLFSNFLEGKESPAAKLPIAERLSGVLRYLASPMRYEPINLPEIHYPVSSFGGLFSCNVNLIHRQHDQQQIDKYTYHPNYHALERLVSKTQPQIDLKSNEFVVGLVGQYWTVGRKYGEYSPYGVVIDSGIVFAQLNYLLRLFGFSFSVEWGELDPLQDYLIDDGACEQLFAAITVKSINDQDISQVLNNPVEKRIAVWQEPDDLYDRFLHLRDMITFFSSPYSAKPVLNDDTTSAVPLRFPNTKAYEHKDMLDVMYGRSAGNDKSGFVGISKELGDDFLDHFLQTMTALRAQRQLIPEEKLLCVNVSWINPSGPAIGVYDDHAQLIYTPSHPEVFYQMIRDSLHSARQLYNLPTMTMQIFISVDIKEITERAGDSGIRLAHMGAGAIVHDICLTAASFGCFARPARMFRESKLAQQLGLEGQVIIQVLVGFGRNNNFSMSLL